MMNPENSPPRRRAYDLEPVLPTALDDAMPPQMVTAVPLSDMSTLGEDTFTGRDVNAHIIPLSPRRIFEAVTHHASSPRKQNTTAPHSPPTGHVFLSARSMFNDELGEDEDTTAISTSEGSSRGRIYFLALICGPLLVGGIIALVFGLVALRGHNTSQQSQSMESVGPPSLGFPPTTSPNTRPVDTGALMPSPTPTLFDDPPFPWFEGNGPTAEPTSSNLLDVNTTMTLPIAPGPTPPAVAITQPPAPTSHPIQEPARTPTPRPIFSTTKLPSTSYTPEPTLSPSKRPTPRPNPAPPPPPPTQRPVSLTTESALAQRDTPSYYHIPVPTRPPSKRPTSRPSQRPTPLPTPNPTKKLTKYPTGPYIPNPTKPTPRPTSLPEEPPTPNPRNPQPLPTPMPTLRPAVSTLPPFGLDRPYLEVTNQPAAIMQELPVPSPIPTKSPRTSPSDEPSGAPSSMPGGTPSSVPSFPPSSAPSLRRATSPPTVASSQNPTAYPTYVPSHFRSEPPTEHPTEAPSSGIATPEPSPRPSVKPTPLPSTLEPTEVPASPSARPSSKPLSEASPPPTILGDIIYPDFRFQPWQDLDTTTRNLALQLGYDEQSWDHPGRNPLEDVSYSRVSVRFSPEYQSILGQLGFTTNSYDCWINHYRASSWDELTQRQIVGFYETLGWTRATWTSQNSRLQPDETESQNWNELTGEQRHAAEQLCYIQELWDQIPLPDW